MKLRRESHRNLKADTAEARRNERRLSGVGTNSATESHAPAELWEKRVPPTPLWTHYNPISSKEFRGEPPSLVVAVALANKTARIAWAVMHRHENYQRVAAAA